MKRVITGIVVVTLALALATSVGLLQFASAFVNIVSPSKGEVCSHGVKSRNNRNIRR